MIVSQFLSWIDSAPSDRRAEAAHALARAYLFSDVTEEVRQDMEAAMTVLLEDPSPDVRFALADALAKQPTAPRHVIAALAADHAEIAVAVLRHSPAFLDLELVDLVASSDPVRQSAIATRTKLPATVSAAIAEIGAAESCEALLANRTAAIAAISLRRMAERFGGRAALRDLLFARGDLPADTRQILVRRLGDLLGQFVTEKSWLGQARAETITREACERATVFIASQSDADDLPALLEHLRLTGQLNAGLLLRALAFAEIDFFEQALATLARLPVERVAVHLRGARVAGLAGIYRRAGLPESALAAFTIAAETLLHDDAPGSAAARILRRFETARDGIPDPIFLMFRRFASEQARDNARAIAQRSRRAA